MLNSKGCFITFEGVDGNGKSTQSNLLYNKLSNLGYNVILTREPGGTSQGEDIRNLLMHSGHSWCLNTELCLINAARSEHIELVIKPALREKKIVICDRFIDSTLVYQAMSRGKDIDVVIKTHQLMFGDLMPDLTFILDAEKDLVKKRLDYRGNNIFDYFEKNIDDIDHKNNLFKLCAKMFPERIVMISANNERGIIHEKIYEKFIERCSKSSLLH